MERKMGSVFWVFKNYRVDVLISFKFLNESINKVDIERILVNVNIISLPIKKKKKVCRTMLFKRIKWIID